MDVGSTGLGGRNSKHMDIDSTNNLHDVKLENNLANNVDENTEFSDSQCCQEHNSRNEINACEASTCSGCLNSKMTSEEILQRKKEVEVLRMEGNNLYRNELYEKSLEMYSKALDICPVEMSEERAILYGNSAATKVKLGSIKGALDDCSTALEYNPQYVKVLLRRAKLYEETEKLDESLDDYKNILTIDKCNIVAINAIERLKRSIEERNENLKKEMLGKMKDLGNTVLKPFGLSTNNFHVQQDPSTGAYSIQFKQT